MARDGACRRAGLSGVDRPAEFERLRRGLYGARGDFSQRVALDGGRKLYLECRGTGSPTVVLEAGTGDLGDVWSLPPSGPEVGGVPGGRAVHPRMRLRPPGHVPAPRSDEPQRSGRDAAQRARHRPRSARASARRPCPGAVRAGRALVRRHGRPSLRDHLPTRIAGLVSVDAQNEDFVAAYKELLTPEQYSAAVLNPEPPPGLENYSALERLSLEVSAAQVRQAQADTPLRRMPVVVLSHSRDLPNPFGFRRSGRSMHSSARSRIRRTELAELVPGTRH